MRILIAILLITIAAIFLFSSNNKAKALMAYTENNDDNTTTETAIFAGGCFWCMEKPFEHLEGVIEAYSGYTGGETQNPTYHEVSAGGTGHYESIRVVYNPEIVTYRELLDTFWRNIDPFDSSGQFCDKGSQYRAAIFVQNAEEQAEAEASLNAMETRFNRQIVTQILPTTTFYDAEDYHQNYYRKNPIRYNFYRRGCGRDNRLEEVWGDNSP